MKVVVGSQPSGYQTSLNKSAQEGTQGESKSTAVMNKTENAKMIRNITRMVIVTVFANTLAQIPYSICHIISFAGISNSTASNALVAATIFIVLMPSIEIFFYYFFNKLFKSVLDSYLKTIAQAFTRIKRLFM